MSTHPHRRSHLLPPAQYAPRANSYCTSPRSHREPAVVQFPRLPPCSYICGPPPPSTDSSSRTSSRCVPQTVSFSHPEVPPGGLFLPRPVPLAVSSCPGVSPSTLSFPLSVTLAVSSYQNVSLLTKRRVHGKPGEFWEAKWVLTWRQGRR